MAQLSPTGRLERFVLRCRRVTEHSLLVTGRELMQKLCDNEMKINITVNKATGETTQVLRQEFPPEEIFESLAARMRPLILPTEEVHYTKALDSIEALVSSADYDTVSDQPISWWRDMWLRTVDRSATASEFGYSVLTDAGSITDRQLMYAWLYGDLVHADTKFEAKVVGLSISQRYWAATGFVARIGVCTELTLGLINALDDEGLLSLNPKVWTQNVTVDTSIREQPVQIYAAINPNPTIPVTASDPLDATVWQTLAELVIPTQADEADASDPHT